jgi:hypothetical protein
MEIRREGQGSRETRTSGGHLLRVLEEDNCPDDRAVSPGQARDVDLEGLAEAGEGAVDTKAAEVLNGHTPSQDDRDELHVTRHASGLLLAHQTDRGTVEEEGLLFNGDFAVVGGEELGVHVTERGGDHGHVEARQLDADSLSDGSRCGQDRRGLSM